jgi:S1-C subfamily serine protease
MAGVEDGLRAHRAFEMSCGWFHEPGKEALMLRSMVGRPLAASLASLVCAGVLVSGTVLAQDRSSRERQRLYYDVKPAVVLVTLGAQADIRARIGNQVVRFQPQIGGSGSGWMITPDGYVVTNGHVVELYHADNEDELSQQLLFQALEENYFPALEQQAGRQLTREEKIQEFVKIFQNSDITLSKTLQVVLQNGKAYDAEVKEYSPPISPFPGKIAIPGYRLKPGKDVAIVKIEGRDLPTVEMGQSEEVQIGETVHVAGYPGAVMQHSYLNPQTALEASFNRGQISSLKLTTQGANVLQFDAAVTWGNSGGPVFNDEGKVIGMATFISLSSATGGQQAVQGFNFAVPVDVVKEFVRSAGVEMGKTSLFDRTWDRALEKFYAKDYKTAVSEFDAALRLMPSLPDAERLRLAALNRGEMAPGDVPATAEASPGEDDEEAAAAATDDGGSALPWILVLLVAGGIAYLLATGKLRLPAMAGSAKTRDPLAETKSMLKPEGRLVVKEGPLQGNGFPLTANGVKIGRDPETCQVVLSEATVSREHAVIMPAGRDSDVTIKNLSGTNPTYVNDRPITEATLKPGDEIKIGSSVLTYEKI